MTARSRCLRCTSWPSLGRFGPLRILGSDSCRLREYAELYGARQSRYKAEERKPIDFQRQGTDVVYEPGKCIACSLCVRLSAQAQEKLGMTFTERGFAVRTGVPFGGSVAAGLSQAAGQCADACPTGALARVRHLSRG